MTILHLSDLHFGAHNQSLVQGLKDAVSDIRPNLILATGDLADSPKESYLLKAKAFLDDLSQSCAQPEAPGLPNVIVTPGNHDKMILGNVMVVRNRYRTIFKERCHAYYPKSRVWVYAMDSARGAGFGAN